MAATYWYSGVLENSILDRERRETLAFCRGEPKPKDKEFVIHLYLKTRDSFATGFHNPGLPPSFLPHEIESRILPFSHAMPFLQIF